MSYKNMTKEQLIQEILYYRKKLDDLDAVVQESNEYKQKYIELIQESLDGFAMLDTNGDFSFCNAVYCKILDYEFEEMKTLSYKDVTPAAYHELDQQQFDKMLDRGFSDLYQKEYTTSAGKLIPIEIRSYLIKDTNGNFSGTWSYVRDISERIRAEKALQESQNRLIQAQRIAMMGDFTWDCETGEVSWSDGLIDLLQYDKSEKIDFEKVNAKIHHPDDLERITLWLKDCIASGKNVLTPNEYRIIRKDGEIIYVRSVGVIERRQGKQPRVFATVQDITERTNLQDQLYQAQKMESVGRLAGGVAHDYNNMLSIIIGYAELALDKLNPTEPLHNDVTAILEAGIRSMNITRQLLAFARQQTIAPKVLDLNESVEHTLKMLRRLIGEDIDLTWRPRAGLWPIKIDPGQIDQILSNLCVNARDAIADVGKITIETDRKSLDEIYCAEHVGFVPGDYVMLVVSDNGCGIETEALKNIFEPFVTTKELGMGTGLGLATVYGIVKQNNGFINVYSEPGKSTTFRIYLPRHGKALIDNKIMDVEEIPRSQGEMILVVEDDNSILKLAEKILMPLDYRVQLAENPFEALKLAEAHSDEISLLITDVIMPGMNGRELSERMQKINPKLKCLFMSGYTANVIAHHGVLNSDVNYLQKPFTKAELALSVRTALDK